MGSKGWVGYPLYLTVSYLCVRRSTLEIISLIQATVTTPTVPRPIVITMAVNKPNRAANCFTSSIRVVLT